MWVNQLRWADRPYTATSLLVLLLGSPTIKPQAVNPMDALPQTEMGNGGTWYVSIAEPWQGNTIRWVDLATSTKLSRWEMTRINNATFTVESFAQVTDKTPNYTASCKRDSQ